MKQSLKVFTLLMVFTYLSISFVKWQFNPQHWDEGVRGLFVFLTSIFLVMSPLLSKIGDTFDSEWV